MAASTGGVFLPNENTTFGKNVTVEGNLAVTGDVTVTGTINDTGSAFVSPAITGTVTGGASYTAPTLTSPTITGTTAIGAGATLTAPTIAAATITGTVTIGNGLTATTPILTSPAITGGTITSSTIASSIDSDFKVLAGNATYTSTITPATLTGFSWTVVPGTYVFQVNLPTTMTTNGGLNFNFLLTTAVLTSIQYQTYASTAADNGTAVSTKGTTTTSGTLLFTSKAAAYTYVTATGSMVVGTGGTFAWQGSQETSAGGGDVTTIALGAWARLTRVA